MSRLVEIEGLTKIFERRGSLFFGGGRATRAVDGVDLTIAKGETLGLVGESGSGKSTTGRLVLRLIEPTAGTIRFEGEDIGRMSRAALRAARQRMQIVFQDPYGSLNPRMTVADILAEALTIHGEGSPAERKRRAAETLDLVRLPASALDRYPHEFSGGQRQRIAIARALALEPELLVADEPVSALDVSIQAQIVNLLQDIQKRLGLAYLIIAHDLPLVHHVTDRIVVLYLGQVMEEGPTGAVVREPLHPYTAALLSAAPEPVPGALADRIVLTGDPPSPMAPPPGCRFQTRCPIAGDRCRQEIPPLSAAGGGRHVRCFFPGELAFRIG